MFKRVNYVCMRLCMYACFVGYVCMLCVSVMYVCYVCMLHMYFMYVRRVCYVCVYVHSYVCRYALHVMIGRVM